MHPGTEPGISHACTPDMRVKDVSGGSTLGSYGSRVILSRGSARINRGSSEQQFVRNTASPLTKSSSRIQLMPETPSIASPTNHPRADESKHLIKAAKEQDWSRRRAMQHRETLEGYHRDLRAATTSLELNRIHTANLERDQAQEERHRIQCVLAADYNSTPHALRKIPASLYIQKAEEVDSTQYETRDQGPDSSPLRCVAWFRK